MDQEAGWYPDPAAEEELRYWDGAVWTAWVTDRSRQVRRSERSLAEWPAPHEGMPTASALADRRSVVDREGRPRRISAVVVLCMAVVTTFVFWWIPNLMIAISGTYWFDDTPVVAVWAWVTVADVALVLVALLEARLLTARHVVMAVGVVALMCIPVAFAVHARLPHNPIPDYRAALDGLERAVPQLRQSGPEKYRTRCKWELDQKDRAYLTRWYEVEEGTAEDALAAAKTYFLRIGYRSGTYSGNEMFGPDSWIWLEVGDVAPQLEVSIERQSCSWLESKSVRKSGMWVSTWLNRGIYGEVLTSQPQVTEAEQFLNTSITNQRATAAP